MRLEAWRREPLVHFLLAGLVLFAAVWWWGPREESRTIRISRDDVLLYMQGRAQVFDEAGFAAALDAMSEKERRALVHDVALQEALFRKGEALGLADADLLIRQRIVQQMRLLLMEDAAMDVGVSEHELQQYYREHRSEYEVPRQVTFTHVYFAAENDVEGTRAAALAKLARLRHGNVSFDQAGQHGERFLYHLNYIDVGAGLVASQFGDEFTRQIFALEPGLWQGPFRSKYGWHNVLVRDREEARQPSLHEVETRVREDALSAKRTRLVNTALEEILAQYTIATSPDVLQ